MWWLWSVISLSAWGSWEDKNDKTDVKVPRIEFRVQWQWREAVGGMGRETSYQHEWGGSGEFPCSGVRGWLTVCTRGPPELWLTLTVTSDMPELGRAESWNSIHHHKTTGHVGWRRGSRRVTVHQNILNRGCPGGWVVKNLPANAGDTSLIPDPGGSHVPQSNWACAPQLLSPCSRAGSCNSWSLWALEPVLCNKRNHGSEKPTHRN